MPEHEIRGHSFSLGASFAASYCHDLGLDPGVTLKALINELGIRRFRLVSHWDQIEARQGTYDFRELDRQLAEISRVAGQVTLCLGIRQPRYPEFHQPGWAKAMGPGDERNKALSTFIKAVVERYKGNPAIISWQLENEALNRSFGEGDDFDRHRLRDEYRLVKKLDPSRSIIMTTSNSWGIPIRRPIPDIVGLSLYRIQHKNNAYRLSPFFADSYRFRAWLIQLIWRIPTLIHELQAECWGPTSTQELSLEEQCYSMSASQLVENVRFAIATGINYADLWGAEYWYWRMKQHGDDSLWLSAKQLFKDYPAT